jgi:Spy/CpxP family protein refolding chaperone
LPRVSVGVETGRRKDQKMKRFTGRLCAIVVATLVVAMVSQVALAQNESKRGRGGRGGGAGGPGGRMGQPSMAMMAMNPKVQEALKLSDDQKSKLEKLSEESMASMRELRSSGGRPDPEKMRKMREEQTDKVNSVLDDSQRKRLMGIFIQVAGNGAVMDPAVGKEIGLTDDQKTKLRDAMGPPPEGGQGGGAQAFRERREKMEKEVSDMLTSDQKAKLESLKGEKVDIDPASLRGGGRGGRNRSGSDAKKSAA